MTVSGLSSVATDVAQGEAATRAAQMTAHVAAFDPHGDRSMGARFGMGRFMATCISSTLSNNSGDSLAVGVRSGGLTLNQIVATPMYAPEAITVRDWRVNVESGLATAVYRLGLWTIDDQAHPLTYTLGARWATLLSNLGTIDCSATGVPTALAAAVAIPAGTWFAVGAAMQVAMATLTVGDSVAGLSSAFGSSASPPSTGRSAAGLAQSGVSGAFGDLTPSAVSTAGHGVGFRRSS